MLSDAALQRFERELHAVKHVGRGRGASTGVARIVLVLLCPRRLPLLLPPPLQSLLAPVGNAVRMVRQREALVGTPDVRPLGGRRQSEHGERLGAVHVLILSLVLS